MKSLAVQICALYVERMEAIQSSGASRCRGPWIWDRIWVLPGLGAGAAVTTGAPVGCLYHLGVDLPATP